MGRLLDALMAYSNKVELQATGIGPLMRDVGEEGTVFCSDARTLWGVGVVAGYAYSCEPNILYYTVCISICIYKQYTMYM